MAIEFTIPGPWVPERKRSYRAGSFTRRVDTPEAKDYKALVRMCAAQVAPAQLLDCPLSLSIVWRRVKPKSYRKCDVYPHRRPDCSNLVKIVEDAITGVLITDDARFCDEHLYKSFSERDECRVRIEALPEYAHEVLLPGEIEAATIRLNVGEGKRRGLIEPDLEADDEDTLVIRLLENEG